MLAMENPCFHILRRVKPSSAVPAYPPSAGANRAQQPCVERLEVRASWPPPSRGWVLIPPQPTSQRMVPWS